MKNNCAFTLLIFCKIFNLSYTAPTSSDISAQHILNLFNWSDDSDGVKPATFCNAIKGKGQLNTRIRHINVFSEKALALIDGFEKNTLQYIYRYVTHKEVGDNPEADLVFEILQAAMSHDKKKHQESANYPEDFINSFRDISRRELRFTSDELLRKSLGDVRKTAETKLADYRSPLISPSDYCAENGISGFSESGSSPEYLSANLADKKEIYILATTGVNLIHALSGNFLAEAISRGVCITVLVPNKYSVFAEDVADIETPGDTHLSRIAYENSFLNLISTLKRELMQANRLNGGVGIGRIFIGNAFTYLRQTITLGINDDEAWGWFSMTMPPSRTLSGTPSFAFSGSVREKGMARHAYSYITAIIEESKRRNGFFEITPDTEVTKFNLGLERQSAKEYWQELYEVARKNMNNKKNNSVNADLIEVAANHPLINGTLPGPEFTSRLDFAAELYNKLTANGSEVMIYVPGSLHCSNGKPDRISLSEAGENYLIKRGIPSKDIFGNTFNDLYKREEGVYNTADECFVAAKAFFENGFARLHVVCSPNQLVRKQLFYLSFGVLPLFHTVPFEDPAHDMIYEIFEAVPDVIYNDHTWQGKDSYHFNRTRKDRMPPKR